MQIQDQGKGISDEKLAAIRSQRAGVGITGMRERVRQLNGVMDIQSNVAGTAVYIALPSAAGSLQLSTGVRQETKAMG
jgi:two-component system sensor histidine kinase UhpB